MSQTTMTFRVDESLKKDFDSLCKEFGFTATSAINVFMKAVVRERKIPFEIKASSKEEIRTRALESIEIIGKQAEESGLKDMSLDEINEEIRAVRYGE